MKSERIEQIRERVAKSSKGIWKTHPIDDTTIISEDREIATTCDSSNTERDDAYNIEYEVMEADAQFIAHARQDIPELLAALEASEAARVKAEMERDEFIAVIEDFEETVDAHKDRITAIEAERDALKERENITDELMASQYRAGAQAGWNAAQLDEPAASKAIASLTEFKKGDLHHVRAANARRALESSK